MKKFVFLAVLAALMSVAPPASATPYLWSRHHSWARLVDGRSAYMGSEFLRLYLYAEIDDVEATTEYMNATGSMTIAGGSYTFWNGTADEAVPGTEKTFNLTAVMDLGDDYLEYQPINNSGELIVFRDAAETGLNGQRVRWEFPTHPELNGQATVPNFKSTAQQLASSVPYVELIRSGGNATRVDYRVVHPSKTGSALSTSAASSIQISLYGHDDTLLWCSEWQSFGAGATPQGTVTLDTPIAEDSLWYVHVRLQHGNEPYWYSWSFVSAADDENKNGKNTSSSGGGGCDAGALAGGLALLLAIPLLRRRRG